MEPSDRAAFSEGGTARDAYLPYLPLGNPSSPSDPSSLGNCAQHTSDGNVQHSSCDEHGDCAVGHALPVGASADVTTGEPVDPQAGHASSRVSCACDHSYELHDHALHASRHAHSEGVSVVAPSAATPQPSGCALASRFRGAP